MGPGEIARTGPPWRPRSLLEDEPNARHALAAAQERIFAVVSVLTDGDRTAGLLNPDACIEFRRVVATEKGKGYGHSIVRTVKQIAFEEFKAHRLWLEVKERNDRARRLYQAEVFVEEGVLRECLRSGQVFESLVVMSQLAHEYHAVSQADGG